MGSQKGKEAKEMEQDDVFRVFFSDLTSECQVRMKEFLDDTDVFVQDTVPLFEIIKETEEEE